MRHKLAITANYKMSFTKIKTLYIKQQEKSVLINEYFLLLFLSSPKGNFICFLRKKEEGRERHTDGRGASTGCLGKYPDRGSACGPRQHWG